MRNKIVYLVWLDAASDHGWEKKKLLGLEEVETCGFLIAEDDKEITLALSIARDEMNAVMSIPKKWVKKRRNLKL